MLCLVIAVSLFHTALAFPEGAPITACAALAPQHSGIAVQETDPPFTITVEEPEWSNIKTLTVSINGDAFKGFLIQARDSVTDEPKGIFSDENLPKGVKIGACQHEDKADSLTHKDTTEKKDLTFTWYPPVAGYEGNVYFQAGIAKEHATYWTGIRSREVPMAIGVDELGSGAGSGDNETESTTQFQIGTFEPEEPGTEDITPDGTTSLVPESGEEVPEEATKATGAGIPVGPADPDNRASEDHSHHQNNPNGASSTVYSFIALFLSLTTFLF